MANWIKNYTALQGRTAEQLQQCLNTGNVAEWTVSGKTNLTTKYKTKEAEVAI